MTQENEKQQNETAHAEEKINDFFYGDSKEENTPHTTDYMNNETAAINIAKPERENE
ncbi:hypothetical protein ACFQPF_18230 [Fictibacillus iocasae]|uniref:DUF4025 domain-containing protein n=1 Tax=Fictibacillus iocasae TaxID=2715437 RepID=A0ABW2NSY9_9BACL